MGIFTRFKDIVAANVNSMLDHAEDPEKMIRMMIREMEETLVELKANCAATMAECRRLSRELEGVQGGVAKWHERAELAVEKGREDLAREALAEKHNEEERANAIMRELTGSEVLVAQAQADITILEEKLTSTKEKQNLLQQRHVHATVRKQARMDSKRTDAYEAVKRFEELEQRVERMEAEAEVEAFGLLKPGTLEDRFAELENSDKVTEELEALKKRLTKE